MIKTVKKSLNYCHRTKYCQNAPLCNRMMMMSSPAPRCDVIRLGSIPENNSQMRIENNVGHIVLAAPPPVLTPPNSQGCVFTRFFFVKSISVKMYLSPSQNDLMMNLTSLARGKMHDFTDQICNFKKEGNN